MRLGGDDLNEPQEQTVPQLSIMIVYNSAWSISI